jgi:hypothetical protein
LCLRPSGRDPLDCGAIQEIARIAILFTGKQKFIDAAGRGKIGRKYGIKTRQPRGPRLK